MNDNDDRSMTDLVRGTNDPEECEDDDTPQPAARIVDFKDAAREAEDERARLEWMGYWVYSTPVTQYAPQFLATMLGNMTAKGMLEVIVGHNRDAVVDKMVRTSCDLAEGMIKEFDRRGWRETGREHKDRGLGDTKG